MNLFEFKNYNITFSPQAIALKPFKAIWDSDKSKNKKTAINELSLVYFMADYSSDFSDILDDEDRLKKIIENIDFGKDFKMNKRITEAIDFYKERSETTSSRLLGVAKTAVRKIEKYINDVEISDKNVKTIFSSTAELDKLTRSIDVLEDQIRKQQSLKNNARGSIDKAEFEDGF